MSRYEVLEDALRCAQRCRDGCCLKDCKSCPVSHSPEELVEAYGYALTYIELWKQLKLGIEDLKSNQNSKNQDYYTGFISALSNVDGLMAFLEERWHIRNG